MLIFLVFHLINLVVGACDFRLVNFLLLFGHLFLCLRGPRPTMLITGQV